MKRFVLLAIPLCIIFSGISAQSTEELLKSKRVSDFIFLVPDFSQKSMKYQLDKVRDLKYDKPLKEQLSVTVSPKDESINIMMRYFNPFRYKINMSDTLLVDENYEALNSFYEAVTTSMSVVQQNSQPISADKPAGLAGASAKAAELTSPLLEEWKYHFSRGNIESCTPDPTPFIKALHDADTSFYKKGDNSFEAEIKTVLTYLNNAESLDLLEKANEKTTAIIALVKKRNDNSKGFISVLKDKVENLSMQDPAGAPAPLYCDLFTAYTKNVLKNFINEISQKQTKREKIHTDLEALSQNITDFMSKAVTNDYQGARIANVKVAEYSVNAEKTTEVTVLFKERKLSFDDEKISLADQENLFSKKIRIRAHRTIIPEFATGLFYTNLKYPTYITASSGDSVVVKEGKPERSPVVAAAHLNLVFDVWSDVCPMIQVGVGTAKERPSILLGGGLRLSKPKRLSVSAGVICTWKKDLTDLVPGSIVKDASVLDSDLKLQLDVKPSLYAGIQYNF